MFSKRWLIVYSYALFILVLSVIPMGENKFLDKPGADKFMHFFLYLLFSFLIIYASPKERDIYYYGFFFAVVWGVFIECLQYFIPYRSFELADILVNTLGAGIGVFSFFLLDKHLSSQR